MKAKPVIGIVAAILMAAIAVEVFLWFWLPQKISLPDGTKLTLAAVTYGKHHVFSSPKIAVKRINTATDTLCVWIREEFAGQSPGDFSVFLWDKAGAFVPEPQPSSAIPPVRARTSPASGWQISRDATESFACKF